MLIKKLKLIEIKPYEKNPRRVAESIRRFGFIDIGDFGFEMDVDFEDNEDNF